MPARKIGYGRVSAKDQNLGRQLEIFKQEGIEERDIFVEKESGRQFDRPVFRSPKSQVLLDRVTASEQKHRACGNGRQSGSAAIIGKSIRSGITLRRRSARILR